LPLAVLKKIIKALKEAFTVSNHAEVSVEVNPATLDNDNLQGFLEAGVTRLSLGVQSFFNEDLDMLGRIHDAGQALQSIELLHRRNLENFNLDLIYGIPGQSMARWEQNLKKALDSQPAHLSLYLLQLDPSTPLAKVIAKGYLNPLDEEVERNMYYLARSLLTKADMVQYEISNYSKPGLECRHNLAYWRHEEYLGIGCGAVSFIEGKRWINRPDLGGYMQDLGNSHNCPVDQLENLSLREQAQEALIMGLRLIKGVNLRDYQDRFGLDPQEVYGREIKKCLELGLIELNDGHIRLTDEGLFLSNTVFCEFI
jgi:oxygen-independent coproporphyrinogen-3 oxidase